MHARQLRQRLPCQLCPCKQLKSSLHTRFLRRAVKHQKAFKPFRQRQILLRHLRQQAARLLALLKPAVDGALARQRRTAAAPVVGQPQHLRQMRHVRVLRADQKARNCLVLAHLGFRHQPLNRVQHAQTRPFALPLHLRAAVRHRGGIGIGQRRHRQRGKLRRCQHLLLLLPHNGRLHLRRRHIFAFLASLAAASCYFAELPVFTINFFLYSTFRTRQDFQTHAKKFRNRKIGFHTASSYK